MMANNEVVLQPALPRCAWTSKGTSLSQSKNLKSGAMEAMAWVFASADMVPRSRMRKKDAKSMGKLSAKALN